MTLGLMVPISERHAFGDAAPRFRDMVEIVRTGEAVGCGSARGGAGSQATRLSNWIAATIGISARYMVLRACRPSSGTIASHGL